MAVSFAPGNNSAKPKLRSWRSSRSLCLRILSSRPPVAAASSTKAHEDRTLNRSSQREQRNWYLIRTMRPNGRLLRTGQQLGKTGTPLFEIFAISLFKNSFFATSCCGSKFHKSSRRQNFEQELTEGTEKLVLDPDHETKWPSLSYRATTRQKPEFPSLRSFQSLCLRILSSRLPVAPAGSTKVHFVKTLNRSYQRHHSDRSLIRTLG